MAEENLSSPLRVSVVVPVFRSHSTLPAALASLNKQDYPIESIIIIDDDPHANPCDQIIAKFMEDSANPTTYIKRKVNRGLAAAYNDAARLSNSDLLITLQADVVITQSDGVKQLVRPFIENKTIVLSCALQETPWDTWWTYGFWQKCLFARHVGRAESGRNGRFCCFSLQALRGIGCFDESTYRTAGEDGDVLVRLQKVGTIVDIPLIVAHLHELDHNFHIYRYIRKENQLAEAQGAFISHHYASIPARELLRILTRPLLVIGCFIDRINMVAIPIIVVYS